MILSRHESVFCLVPYGTGSPALPALPRRENRENRENEDHTLLAGICSRVGYRVHYP